MIREARIADYEDIHHLCESDMGYICDKERVKLRLSTLDHSRECVFVADQECRIVGFIHVEKYEVLYAPSMANILGIAISERFRRQGLGRQLLAAAEEWAKSKEITLMRLNSGKTREEAHLFYRSMGYSDDKEQLRFIKAI